MKKSWVEQVRAFFEDKVFAVLLILVAVFFIYRNSLQNGFVLDGLLHLQHWAKSASLDWKRIALMPLPSVSEQLTVFPLRHFVLFYLFKLFSYEPFAYHLVSILTHCGVIFFVYRFALVFIKDAFIAFIVTLLFAAHPLQTSLVSLTSGGGTLLGVLFSLIAFHFFMRFKKRNQMVVFHHYIFAVIFFILSLGLYGGAVALPFLLAWFDICFYREEPWGRKILPLMFFLFLSLIALNVQIFILKQYSEFCFLNGRAALSVIMALKAFLKYILLFLFPVHLTHNHTFSYGIASFSPQDFDRSALLSQSFFDLQTLIAFICCAGMLYAMFKIRTRQQNLAFFLGWIVLGIAPYLIDIKGYVIFQEHYFYLASIGVVLLLGEALKLLFVRLDQTPMKFLICILCIVFCLLGGRTIMRNAELRDEVTLYKAAVSLAPWNKSLQYGLAAAYLNRGDGDAALKVLQNFAQKYQSEADVYYFMSEIFMAQREDVRAVKMLKRAIVLDPLYVEAYYRLAGIYQTWSMRSDAMIYLEAAYYAYKRKGGKLSLKEFINDFFANYEDAGAERSQSPENEPSQP